MSINRIHWAVLSGFTFAMGVLVGLLAVYLTPFIYEIGGPAFAVVMALFFVVMGAVFFFISFDSFSEAWAVPIKEPEEVI